ncbi:cysteine ABC transporter permease [Altererythrobacter sp. B11]|uniref:ATP-binding cassette domain-containing protein n=1 Tax=Altererythrobacter sp. B11 TaxID=2060312 RepID=UPI000DC6DE4C|nr:ATP-binding cassette domain-containing protein [Altererythrobacter sp. B11]BBC70991.1 cysteine ABC transporter permease [Altererythrobacter sp. B11]
MLDITGAALFAGGLAVAIGQGLHASAQALLPASLILAGALLRAAGLYGVAATGMDAAQAATAARRGRLWPRLLGGALPRPLLSGESAALAIDHLQAVEDHDSRYLPVRLNAALGPLIVLAIVAMASWVAALILLGTLLPFILGMVLAGTAARRASDRQLAALSALSGLFVDRLRNLRLIRHFAAEDRLARQVRQATREVAQRTVAVLRLAFLSSAVLEFFSALAVALVAVYCGFSLLGLLPFAPPERLTLATAFFALAMAPEFYLPMRRLAAVYHEKQLGEAARDALAAAAPDVPAPSADEISAVPLSAFDGLALRDLRLSWPGTEIGPVDLLLERCDFAAITGPTGSGKSTTLAAIAGQVAPSAGTIRTASGLPLDPRAVAWAAQRPLLLPGTLGENIALAAPQASAAEIAAVAERVGLGALLARRGGLALPLDHNGSGLSGGERRRIGLARAILSGRPLLLCDEPTADLDPASAAAIVALLQDLAGERCILAATHDPLVASAARLQVAL